MDHTRRQPHFEHTNSEGGLLALGLRASHPLGVRIARERIIASIFTMKVRVWVSFSCTLRDYA